MLLKELFTVKELRLHYPVVGVYSGYRVLDTNHVFTRAGQRGIPEVALTVILKRLGRCRKFIEEQATVQGVSLYDSKTGVHLIVKKFDDPKRNDLMLITTYRDHNYRGRTPVCKVR